MSKETQDLAFTEWRNKLEEHIDYQVWIPEIELMEPDNLPPFPELHILSSGSINYVTGKYPVQIHTQFRPKNDMLPIFVEQKILVYGYIVWRRKG